MDWAVSMKYMTGVSTVTVFPTQEQAVSHADAMTEFKGCRVFVGWEVVAKIEEDTNDD